jgi:hypothetical protein
MTDYKKPANIGYAIIFVLMFIILGFVFIVLLPMALTFNTALWYNGEFMMTNGVIAAGKIQNVTVRNAVLGVFQSSETSFIDSQTIIGLVTQYGWILIVVVVVVLIILLARRQVETGVI